MTAGRLGKREAVPDERDITFGALRAESPGVDWPETLPWSFGHGRAFADWEMLGNGPDPSVRPGFGGAGCCVFSGGDHEHMLATKLGAPPTADFNGATAIADYSAVTGYIIGDDSTDQGTYVRDAMKFRRSTGLIDAAGARHKIGAYVSINPKDFYELLLATYVFTAVGIGFEFPETAWEQTDNGEPWDVVDENASIDGGHYVCTVGRAGKDTVGVVTWGKRQAMTRAFYERYNDETWAIVFPETLHRNGINERGYDLSALSTLLGRLS